MNRQTPPMLRRPMGLRAFFLMFTLTIASSLVLSACDDSETNGDSGADASPAMGSDPAGTPENDQDDDRGGQGLANRSCESAGNLPIDGILGLSIPPSPRGDSSAEVLALDSGDEVVAGEARYQRISAELAGLRSAFPDRTDAEAEPCFPSSIVATLGSSLASTTLFNDYNTLLRAQLALQGDGETVVIKFDGIYNIKTLAEQYDALPNIEFATPGVTRGDSSDICVEELANNSHLYIFDQGSGDCPSGCQQHNFSGFTVDADGNIADLGSFQPQTEAEPDWFAQAATCRNFL